MISDSEFVMIRAFDRTLRENSDEGQRIINAKNRQLVSHSRRINEQAQRIAAQADRIAALEAALLAERAKSASMLAQVRGMIRK